MGKVEFDPRDDICLELNEVVAANERQKILSLVALEQPKVVLDAAVIRFTSNATVDDLLNGVLELTEVRVDNASNTGLPPRTDELFSAAFAMSTAEQLRGNGERSAVPPKWHVLGRALLSHERDKLVQSQRGRRRLRGVVEEGLQSFPTKIVCRLPDEVLVSLDLVSEHRDSSLIEDVVPRETIALDMHV